MNEDYVRWPPFTRIPSNVIHLYEESTKSGRYDLNTAERLWRDLYPIFKRLGYRLRARYEPGWSPSWVGTNVDPFFCEDSIMPVVPHVIDATRADGLLVSIKRVKKTTNEIAIGRYLTSPDFLRNPVNHCVPLLDVLPDPISQDVSYIVMPHLLPFNKPKFVFVGEIIDFVGQTLQGLSFMHDQKVAHRDCTGLNILMDGGPLYPQGFHPLRPTYSKNAVLELTPLDRIDHPVRYYFIDFGLSSRFLPGEAPLVTGTNGRDQDVPELSSDVPYNAFKTDVFILGNVYRKDLCEKYQGLDFLDSLVNDMTASEPTKRPSADGATSAFIQIHASLDSNVSRLRMRSKDESIPERIVRDTVAAAVEGMTSLRRLVGA